MNTHEPPAASPAAGAAPRRSPHLAVAGAILGALAVTLGAFGAHGLESHFAASDPKLFGWWETASLYHLVHAPAIFAAGLWRLHRGRGAAGGWLLALGVAIFCGTLYAMALGAPRWFGAITPLGGVALIVGWAALGLAGWRGGDSET